MPKATTVSAIASALGCAVLVCALSAPIALSSFADASLPEEKLPRLTYEQPVGLPMLHQDLQTLVHDVEQEVSQTLHPEEKCLAQAVYFEARSEPLEGQLAVAQVVLNRVLDSRYPTTICGVVFQGEAKRHKCQFSFACDGQSDAPRNQTAWTTAKHVSHVALQGYWDDLTADATHYHADYVMPYWGEILEARVQHGRHIFYSDSSF